MPPDEATTASETVAFLLKTAARLREMADQLTDIAAQQGIRAVADECEADALTLAQEYGIDNGST